MKDTFLKILELIHYEGDKEDWVNKALATINLNSFNKLVSSLPEEKQKEMEQNLQGENAIQKIPQVLAEYFSSEQIQEQIEKSSIEFIEKYLEEVFPQLPEDQQKSVEEYFNSVAPQPT